MVFYGFYMIFIVLYEFLYSFIWIYRGFILALGCFFGDYESNGPPLATSKVQRAWVARDSFLGAEGGGEDGGKEPRF